MVTLFVAAVNVLIPDTKLKYLEIGNIKISVGFRLASHTTINN